MIRVAFAAGLVALASGLASCAHDAKPPEAPVDFAIPPIGKVASPTPDEPPKVESCHALLFANGISKSSYGCVIEEQISKNQGILTYPCTGNGDAEAAFGEELYTGQIRDGELDLEVKNEFDWPGDGCRWGTTANIRGRVTTERQLSWSYRDYAVRGTACSGTCTATSVFSVRRQSTKTDDDDDDDR